MGKIVTFGFCESFIDRLSDYLKEHYADRRGDLRRLAIVFPGKRPAMFLKRHLARSMGRGFYPPRFFTIDEFMRQVLARAENFSAARDLDQCYELYRITQTKAPEILAGREYFAAFLPWIREVLSFIDQLDLENVPNEKLRHIEDNAEIGYAVPPDVNRLLENIVALRRAYHEHMKKNATYSRGYQYLRAAEVIAEVKLPEFEQILFCNFFYLHRSEEAVMQTLYEREQATLFLQGDERRWPVFRRIAKKFKSQVVEGDSPAAPKFNLQLYSGFDVHSQVCQVREILRTIKDTSKTVIVLPETDHLIPLLSEIAVGIKDFNVSMGYPLSRSALYSLIQFIFGAQLSRGSLGYYTRDYLKVLRHPLTKNLDFGSGETVTRILIHKIEEVLTGQEQAAISGAVFLKPEDLLETEEVYELALKTLKNIGVISSRSELKKIFKTLQDVLFGAWEGVKNFQQFAESLKALMDLFIEKSHLEKYPLNAKIAWRILDIIEELRLVSFSDEAFPLSDLFKIASGRIERELVAFTGSPLKGLQILGLFETRALNFENVIIMDTNEGALPHLNIYEPLIPREVMIGLNLDRLELEEEIQRYQFMRLIASAKNVHLVYQESRDKEKSRFVEELIWEEQKKAGRMDAVTVARPSFTVEVETRPRAVAKTPEMVEFLKRFRYSASSINTYLRNPMEFYENYVLGLREKEDLLEEPENRQVGTFVHQLLQETFVKFLNTKPVIDQKFRRYFDKVFEEKYALTFGRSLRPDSFLLKSVLEERLKRFLDNEADNPERLLAKILFIEKRFEDQIPLSAGKISFVYQMDRIDEMTDGSILIIDYKTGSIDPMPKAIERIESINLSRENIRDHVKSFQIPLYFYYLDRSYPDRTINAAFYNLRTLELNEFIDSRMAFERGRITSAFLRALDYVVKEILDPKKDFVEDSG